MKIMKIKRKLHVKTIPFIQSKIQTLKYTRIDIHKKFTTNIYDRRRECEQNKFELFI